MAELFLACQTQWRHAGMDGTLTGLDYSGVAAAARFLRLRVTPEIFACLRVMEMAALAEFMAARGNG